ncbi:16S rRNA (cytidine(1402)-2'-O)-methyltransferase [Patescibacteria group bacterium AH-259-L05]|nr:16S rRNA (cytidine(1402)-2'-O)-methyltransferase [Patescibacteria group bacterium AH-259-L05]
MELYIVATPIGNLKDVSFRAIEILKAVDYILCEDTRQTKKLLSHYHITTPTISYHQHSKLKKVNYILDLLRQGKNCALTSDAGTPSISDPGNKLISVAHKKIHGLEIIPIPGPSALVAALSISGFPADQFIFYGFLPRKKGRQKILARIIKSETTSVIYESPYRIIKTLQELRVLGLDRGIVVCRELTKKFETIYRGTISEVIDQINKDTIKGEFVIVIAP